MKKPRFSNDNFKILQQQLHRLSDQTLAADSDFALQHLEEWILHHFHLTKAQIDDLYHNDRITKMKFALDISFAISNRLSINFKNKSSIYQIDKQPLALRFSELEIDWGEVLRHR